MDPAEQVAERILNGLFLVPSGMRKEEIRIIATALREREAQVWTLASDALKNYSDPAGPVQADLVVGEWVLEFRRRAAAALRKDGDDA